MNIVEAVDEMTAVFKAAWEELGEYPVAYSDVPGFVIPQDGSTPWARFTVIHAEGNQSSLADDTGNQKYESRGLIWVQIYAPLGDGGLKASQLAGSVLNAFRRARGSVWFRNAHIGGMKPDGAYTEISVRANFLYDEILTR